MLVLLSSLAPGPHRGVFAAGHLEAGLSHHVDPGSSEASRRVERSAVGGGALEAGMTFGRRRFAGALGLEVGARSGRRARDERFAHVDLGPCLRLGGRGARDRVLVGVDVGPRFSLPVGDPASADLVPYGGVSVAWWRTLARRPWMLGVELGYRAAGLPAEPMQHMVTLRMTFGGIWE